MRYYDGLDLQINSASLGMRLLADLIVACGVVATALNRLPSL
jgi:hypothetical protein